MLALCGLLSSHILQRKEEQRWFLAQWSSHTSEAVPPPPLSGSVRGAADKAANLGGESPLPSDCPIRTASISDVREGNDPCGARMYTSRPPYERCRIGGSDRGGKQIQRPEAKRMTAASK